MSKNLKRQVKQLTAAISVETNEERRAEQAGRLARLTERRLATKPQWVREALKQHVGPQDNGAEAIDERAAQPNDELQVAPAHQHGPGCKH